jgi:hypothetical protein
MIERQGQRLRRLRELVQPIGLRLLLHPAVAGRIVDEAVCLWQIGGGSA